jgi:hypothetical protein
MSMSLLEICYTMHKLINDQGAHDAQPSRERTSHRVYCGARSSLVGADIRIQPDLRHFTITLLSHSVETRILRYGQLVRTNQGFF